MVKIYSLCFPFLFLVRQQVRTEIAEQLGWMIMILCADIHGPKTMNVNGFGYLLTSSVDKHSTYPVK